VRLENSSGFGRAERRRLERIVGENVDILLGAWNEFFGG
jgi:hypothetical protein